MSNKRLSLESRYLLYTIRLSQMNLWAAGLGVFLAAVSISSPCARAESIKEKRALAYKSAKAAMSPDLYLVYRVADRIITTNNIKRPIRVAVRNNVEPRSDMPKIIQERVWSSPIHYIP